MDHTRRHASASASTSFERGAFRKSADHYQAALKVLRSEAGPTAPETLAVTIKLGETLRELGKYEEAERLLRDGLETSRRTLGAEHTTVRDALFQLHKLAQEQDKDDAVKADWVAQLRQHIASRQRTFGTDDVETLEAVEQLAELLCDSGSHQEATPLLQQLVADRRRVLGPTHRETLEAEGNLAMSWLSQGKAAEAEEAMRQPGSQTQPARSPPREHSRSDEQPGGYPDSPATSSRKPNRCFGKRVTGAGTTLGADHPRTSSCQANLGLGVDAAQQAGRCGTALSGRVGDNVPHTKQRALRGGPGGLLAEPTAPADGQIRRGRGGRPAEPRRSAQSLPPEHTIRGEAMIQLALTLRSASQ